MKKLLTLILIVALLVTSTALAGCAKQEKPEVNYYVVATFVGFDFERKIAIFDCGNLDTAADDYKTFLHLALNPDEIINFPEVGQKVKIGVCVGVSFWSDGDGSLGSIEEINYNYSK